MRAVARVAVLAALFCGAIFWGSQALMASPAPTTGSPTTITLPDAFASTDSGASSFDLADPFIADDFSAPQRSAPIVVHDTTRALNHDPLAESPAIALPPAVSSGMGLLCVLALCMALRRFAYRPAHVSRKY